MRNCLRDALALPALTDPTYCTKLQEYLLCSLERDLRAIFTLDSKWRWHEKLTSFQFVGYVLLPAFELLAQNCETSGSSGDPPTGSCCITDCSCLTCGEVAVDARLAMVEEGGSFGLLR